MIVLAAVLLLLVLAPAATAKGVMDAQICGPDACIAALTQDTYIAFEGGEPAAAPRDARAPYYELRFKRLGGAGGAGPAPQEVAVRPRFVPSAGVVRGEDGTWVRPPARASEALAGMATGVEPFRPRPAVATSSGGSGEGPGTLVLSLIGVALVLGATGLAGHATRRRRVAARG